MPQLTQATLNEVGKAFEGQSAASILRWAADIFGPRVAVLSAMQQAGSVVCHMVGQLGLKMPVLFVDTGVNFQETLETRDRIGTEYGLEVITLSPRQTMAEQTRDLGILYLTPEGQKECCHLRKTVPLLEIRGQYDCLVGSLRRADGGRRGGVPILSVDPEMNCIRLNPLAGFSDEDFAAYLMKPDVIVNPLHSQGFSTIGCNRCTTPVLPEEPKRAGRWRHLGSWAMYCGINPTDVEGGLKKSIDVPQPLLDKLLGRSVDFSI